MFEALLLLQVVVGDVVLRAYEAHVVVEWAGVVEDAIEHRLVQLLGQEKFCQ